MNAAQRRALLGDEVADRIEAEAQAAIAEHPPSPELLDRLRPILTAPRRSESAASDARTAA